MRRSIGLYILALPALALVATLAGKSAAVGADPSPRPLVEVICPLMEKAARESGLSPALFVRLIWRESAFRPNTVSHKGAQGIAQFMPGTAKERGLEDPFDPVQAIPHSAQLLADHVKAFGNFGLAAAAYNAGPERVRGWLGGTRTLPDETRTYVQFITGHSADRWRAAGAGPAEPAALSSDELQASCRKRAPAMVHVALPEKRAGQPGAVQRKPQPKPQPWGVQLAADFSQTKVAGKLGAIRKRHARLLADVEPMYVPDRNLSRGRKAMIALRIGADTRQDALKLCERLRADGGVCTVQKN